MEIKILNKDAKNLKFLIKDINYVIANTLRRLIMGEVPCLSIEEVNFQKNTSALYDEILAHRLGLVPLKTDLRSYTLPSKCRCAGKGCAHCQLHLKLKVKGPCIVYAADLKSQDPKIKAIYPKMPIVNLLKDQELELEATAILGQGNDHMKFSPGLVFYQAYPEIKTSSSKNIKKAAEVCPSKILKLAGSTLKVTDPLKCNLCRACEQYGVEVKSSDSDFIFTIESFGQLTSKEMVTRALDILNNKLKEFTKLVTKIK